MKKILVAMMLVIVPYAAHAMEIFMDEDFGTGSEPSENGNCTTDECYDSGLCYYVGGADDYQGQSCSSYCGDRGWSVVFDESTGHLGCGCNLTPGEEWRPDGTGRERKYIVTPTDCSGGETVTATNEYRCTAGYYGTNGNCTRCPGVKNAAGVMVYGNTPVGATSRSECSLPAGTYKDATGTFKMHGPCAHS